MSEEVIIQTVLGFTSQFVFLWARTYNVHSTANLEIKNTLMSGALIHMLWLVGIAVGSNGTLKVIVDHDWSYIPVILGTLIGSLLGCYGGLIQKRNQIRKSDKDVKVNNDAKNIHSPSR